MRALFITFLIILTPITTLSAQEKEQSIYKIVLQTSNYSYDQLLDFVEEQLSEDKDIARFFYYWLSQNISYDTNMSDLDLLQSDRTQSTMPQNVFKERKTTCMGFTNLYASFLSYFDIDHRTVLGYSKHNANLLKGIRPGLDHAWSAIWINSEWHLVDATWGNYFINEPTSRDHYFMTDPKAFANDHLPMDEEWQLLDEKLDLNAFESSPIASPGFFSMTRKSEPIVQVSKNIEGLTVISIANPRIFQLTLRAVNQEDEIAMKLKYRVRQKNGQIHFILKNYNPDFALRLDAQRTTQNGTWFKYEGLVYVRDLEWTSRYSKFSNFSTKQNRRRK